MPPNPKVLALMSHALPPATGAISFFIPGRDSKIAWRNAMNTAEIIRMVVNVGTTLGFEGERVPLRELVERCYATGTFPSVWLVEGLGHYYADLWYERNETPKDVLTDPQLHDLPAKSMTMLHAGIGLSFAHQTLLKVAPNSSHEEYRKAVSHIVELCKQSSRPGYTGAALESIGLVARNFHGLTVMKAVHRALAEVDPDSVGYLFRGAGRAVYFSAPNFIPGWRTPWRAMALTQQEPSDEQGRRNMRAGFAWASTVVNMRHPIIMETILKHHGAELSADDAFSNGVMSSLMMRYDTSPDDPYVERFCNYRPASSDAKVVEWWNRLVKGPAEKALQEYYPVLQETNHLEEVFRYQDLGKLVKRLKDSAIQPG
jgi:hypothetical protein